MARVSKTDVAAAIDRMYVGDEVARAHRLLSKSAAKAVNFEGDLALDGDRGFVAATVAEAAEWVASVLVETGEALTW